MMYVTTIDIPDHTPSEYRALLDQMGVETRPEANIFLHLTVEMEKGFRVIELWDDKQAFEDFLQNRLIPAAKVLKIDHKADISVLPLYKLLRAPA